MAATRFLGGRPALFRLAYALIAIALLTVLPPAALAAPPNDDFEDAIAIRLGQTVKGTITGATAEATYEGSERSVWYRFRATREGLVNVGLCGARFYSAIAVYVGRSLGSLRRFRYSEDGCRAGGFGVAFRPRRGRSYAVAVLGMAAPRVPRGSFRLRVASIPTPPNDDFADAVPLRVGSTLSGTTAGGTGEPGEPRRCCGFAHTVWYRLRVDTPSQVRLHACNRSHPRIAVYTGDRVNGLTEVSEFGICFVQFAAQPGVRYSVFVDDQGGWGTFRLSALAVTPPPNDDFVDATVITLGNTVSATTLYASREPSEPIDPEYPVAPFTVWFRLPVVSTTVIELDWSGSGDCGRGVDAVNVYTGEQLSQLQKVSQDDVPTMGPCAFRFDATPGVYSIRAAAGVHGEGNFQLTARAVQPQP
ncbi:MAG TPA: hypothetical protein VF056_15085 [Thermoleophilaceae bacterium]